MKVSLFLNLHDFTISEGENQYWHSPDIYHPAILKQFCSFCYSEWGEENGHLFKDFCFFANMSQQLAGKPITDHKFFPLFTLMLQAIKLSSLQQ